MKKIVLLSLIFFVSLSCDKQKLGLEEFMEPILLSEQESFEIVFSDEYQEYFALKYEFLNRVEAALQNGYSASLLTEISLASINQENHELFYQILFNEYSEGEHYVEELSKAHYNLYNKFPVLNSIYQDNEGTLSEHQISHFYNNLEERGIDIKAITLSSKDKEIVCGSYWQQVKLLACAGLCGAATAGAGAVLCGWACWCMLCSENSGVADAIC